MPYLLPKRLKNPTLWGRTYLYSPYKGLPPLPAIIPAVQMAIDDINNSSEYLKDYHLELFDKGLSI